MVDVLVRAGKTDDAHGWDSLHYAKPDHWPPTETLCGKVLGDAVEIHEHLGTWKSCENCLRLRRRQEETEARATAKATPRPRKPKTPKGRTSTEARVTATATTAPPPEPTPINPALNDETTPAAQLEEGK